MLSEKRDEPAARAFFNKAIVSSGMPEKVNIDKSCSNTATLDRIDCVETMSLAVAIQRLESNDPKWAYLSLDSILLVNLTVFCN